MPVALILLVMMGAAVATVTAQSSTPTTTATVTSPEGLNLRSAPSTGGSVVEIIPFDATVSVTGSPTPDNWYPVTHGGQSGWASGQYLSAGILDAAAARTAVSLVATSPRSASAAATPGAGGIQAAGAVPQITNPASAPGTVIEVTASYYGIDDRTVAGTMMACGAPFDPYNAHTASSNDFSCGTKLLVTGPDGRQVDVVVADHGQYATHWMDLTYSGFAQIADHKQGVVHATVKVLP